MANFPKLKLKANMNDPKLNILKNWNLLFSNLLNKRHFKDKLYLLKHIEMEKM